MKHLYLYVLLALLIPLSGRGETAFRTFTAPDGRTLEAAIRAYQDSSGKIKIERKGGKTMWVTPAAFSEADQDYIQQWIKADHFMSTMDFRINVSKAKNETDRKDMASGLKEQIKTEVVYTIEMKNNTDTPLDNLDIELRVFVETDDAESDEKVSIDGARIAKISLADRESANHAFKPIALYRNFAIQSSYDYYSGTSYSAVETSEQTIKGVWIKVYGPELDGDRAVRDWYSDPDVPKNFIWRDVDKKSADTRQTGQRKSQSDETYQCGIGKDSLSATDPEKALKFMHERYEKDPSAKMAKNIGYTYVWRLKPRNMALGLEWLEKAAEKKDSSACRLLAGIYSSHYGNQFKTYFSLEKTVIYAEQSVSIGLHNSILPYQCMAKAYAVEEQFEKAVEYQQRAIDIYKKQSGSKKNNHLTKMKETLRLYTLKKVE